MVKEIPSQLHIFYAVAKQGSFSAAARQIGISPQAASKAISQLEKKISTRLFNRSTHYLTLTSNGERLLKNTQGLAAQLSEEISKFKESDNIPHGKIKINLPVKFGLDIVMPRLVAFKAQYPDVELDIHFSDSTKDLIKEGFDIGIGNWIEPTSYLIAKKFVEMKVYTVASKEYLKHHPEPKCINDLKAHNNICFRSPNSGRITHWPFLVNGEQHLYTPTGSIVVDNYAAAQQFVCHHMGIAMIGDWLIQSQIDSGDVVSLLDEFKPKPRTIWIYYASKEYLPKPIRKLIDFLIQY